MALALVTGAAGALGGDVARALARRGDAVALLNRPQARGKLEALAAEIGHDATIHVAWDELADRPIELAALVAGGLQAARRSTRRRTTRRTGR